MKRRWSSLGILLLVAGCDEAELTGEAAARPAADVMQAEDETEAAGQERMGPEFTVESPTHDFGEIWDFQSQKTVFPFRNTGDSLLVISDIKTTCGCTVPTLEKKQYAPGEGGEIEVAYQPKGSGYKPNVITVISNAWQAGREPLEGETLTRLKISAYVKAFAELEPKFIQFPNAQLGEEARETVIVSGTDPNLVVESVKVYGDHFSARIVTPEVEGPPAPEALESRKVEVVLSEDAPWGESTGTLLVTCRGEVDGRKILRNVRAGIQARVYGDLDAGVGRFNLGIVTPGKVFEKSLLLTSRSGEPFELQEVAVEESTAKKTEAWAERLESEKQVGYRIHIRGEATAKGSVTGKVRIRTDVEGEEEFYLPFGGAVRGERSSQ